MRPRMLMAVYNDLATDARVQRSAEALAKAFDLLVIHTGKPYRAETYETLSVDLRNQASAWQKYSQFGKALKQAATKFQPKIVYAHDYFCALWGWQSARRTRAKLVYDAHELIIPEKGLHYGLRDRLFQRLEAWTVKRTKLVVAANMPRAMRMVRHYRLPNLPLIVRNVPEPFEMPERTRTDEGFVLLYQGDLSLSRGLGKFVEALAILPDWVRLRFVGDGPDREVLETLVMDMNLGYRVTFTGKLPFTALPEEMANADVGLLSYVATDANNVFCAPNKVYEYAQAGLPMVAVGSRYLVDWVESSEIGLGVLTEEANPHLIAEAIEAVLECREDFRRAALWFSATQDGQADRQALVQACSTLTEAA